MDDSRPADALRQGRELYARSEWLAAHDALALADAAAPLPARDLELLATSAHMLGHDEEHLGALERAHHSHSRSGDAVSASRCAFWLGLILMGRGETGPASGWLARAQRLVEREEGDLAERGYLLLPVVLHRAAAGDFEAAYATAAMAAEIGQRLGDPDLMALGMHEQGHALLRQGQVERGLELLDEAMVAVCAGELSPVVTGLLYCSVIGYCQEVYALGRAREWTNALTRWCARQPDMVAFTGVCLVHRAEIMQLNGAWQEALTSPSGQPGASPCRTIAPPRGRRTISRVSSIACRGDSRRPRRLTAPQAGRVWSRSPAWCSCGSSRATTRPRRPQSAGSRARPPIR